LTNVQGKIVAHGFALIRDDSILFVSAKGCGEGIVRHVDRYVIREDVALNNCTSEYGEFLLCGPEWETKISDLRSLAEPWRHQPIEFAGCQVTLVRTRWSTTFNAMLLFPENSRAQIAEGLFRLGAMECNDTWFDTLRIEAGFPEYGRDISDANLPQEVDRNEEAISFKKGCYLGQETVARIDALGHVNWLLRGVEASSDVSMEPGQEISEGASVVAKIKSVANGPAGNQSIGLAFVRTARAAEGNQIALGDHTITVRELPFRSAG
jgi:folate-binding protein YgfZ